MAIMPVSLYLSHGMGRRTTAAVVGTGLALVLTGLGVSSLSMAPSKVPIVRLALSSHTLPECQRLATVAREAATALAALQAVRSRASSELTDLL